MEDICTSPRLVRSKACIERMEDRFRQPQGILGSAPRNAAVRRQIEPFHVSSSVACLDEG
jgi:hypothetical protein